MRVLRYGDDALLVEVDDLDEVRRVDLALRAARSHAPHEHAPYEHGAATLAHVVDLVPAARSVLLRVDARGDLDALAREVTRLVTDSTTSSSAGASPESTAPTSTAPTSTARPDAAGVVELPVVYDGIDLREVAELTGLAVGDVVRRHTAALYTVAFGGFMPGFAYLVGLDPSLRVPRRDTPRERVPAGSVAIADTFSAVYPRATPGGWRLLGRCATTLFDVDRDPPALLTPGTAVRFVPVTP
ncbi:5-oxoprolinase subunit B family protein [Cellulomonas composti]|uniref:Allophanate hydrolase n=1 Tax=Cellulomonas composti TaxID=266130 RepID=A0A511JCT6_9CELL|nr:allophanate hydrolase subunit 1 [Cellulomonas composti]GEL95795.1 allophanate hydrolase [Cellulomonas composti]